MLVKTFSTTTRKVEADDEIGTDIIPLSEKGVKLSGYKNIGVVTPPSTAVPRKIGNKKAELSMEADNLRETHTGCNTSFN